VKNLENLDAHLARARRVVYRRIDERDAIERDRTRLDVYDARDRINRLYARAVRELLDQHYADRIRFGVRERLLVRIRP